MKRAAIIMAKVPAAGKVKTRLHDVLSPERCASLASAFLKDAENKVKAAGHSVIVAFFPPEERKIVEQIVSEQSTLAEQKGANLGERIFNAFTFAFEAGADSAVMIGTDSPTIPYDFIEQAFEFLETNSDAVLGKSEDGGFYLIGLRVLHPELFAGVEWSSPKTFERVFENIHRLGLHLREVPSWYDVDKPSDLSLLREELLNNRNARRRAPHTFEWIESNLL